MASASTLNRSLELAGTLPALMVAADRVAATVIQGVHGRRRVGQGDAFWQYRPYREGDAASQIDWRQSARSRHLFVRETEWEAAASVWLWRDASPSMQYASLRNTDTKAVRAGRPESSDLDVVRQRVAWGPGPRASQAFMLASRARAIIQGRLAPSVDDVVALAGPILRHRMAVNFSARAEGITVETVISQMCARLG